MNAEPAPAFVDTNVLVYAHDRSAGDRHIRARALVAELWESRMGCLSTQVLEELYVTLTRKVPQPLDGATARQIVEGLSHWRVHAPDAVDVLQAIDIQQRYGISLWDALIIRSASALGCTVLWSEDLNPGQVYEGVPVACPFALLSGPPTAET